MSLHIERRKRLRKRPPRLVYVELGNGNGGMMRDLSEDGFALRAMMPLATGESMHFCLSLEDTTRIEGESQVIWTGEGGRAAGLKFVEITSDARAQIREWLAKVEEFPKEEERGATGKSRAELVEQLKREARSVPPRPTAVKQDSPISIAVPDSEERLEQREEEPVGLAEPRSVSVASQMLTPAPAATPAAPQVSAPPVSAAAPPASASHVSPVNQAVAWQKQPPVLVPLPVLEYETEGGELAAARAVRSSLLSRTAGVILLLCLGAAAVIYHQEIGYELIWLGQELVVIGQDDAPQNKAQETSPSNAAPSGAPSNPVATGNENSASNPVKSAKDQEHKRPQPPPASDPADSDTENPNKEMAYTPQPETKPEGNSTATDATQDTGQAEYGEASRILSGSDVNTRLPDAVRLLWTAVEKGNASAEVTLAGLYRRGRGVNKNCEQARVLLSAAARKGSAAAQRDLQEVVRNGCE